MRAWWWPLKRWARDVALDVSSGSPLIPSRQRWRLLRLLGLDASRSTIYARSYFGGRGITIGRNVFLNREILVDGSGAVVIEDDVGIAPRVTILTSTHAPGPAHRRLGQVESRPVRICRGTWVGAGVTVLPGVTIGPGCIIAAGAVVVSDCEPHGLYAGVPAGRVKDLQQDSPS